MTIQADSIQIHQLLLNLCINAVHAMDEQGTLSITVDEVTFDEAVPAHLPGSKPGRYGYLSVSDTGHGMEPVMIERIFEPFFTTKDVGKGTGIGLSVVQSIVKNHGGYIYVESEPGKGTVFHMYFPAVVGRKVERHPGKDAFFPPPAVGKERILFVDDEEMVTNVGKIMLEQLGYSVTACIRSDEALELFKRKPDGFDLVITDQIMPNLPGSELAKQMLQIRVDLPIILCTGFSSKVDQEKAREIGIREFALKPLDHREIAFLIRKVLDGEGLERQ